MAQFDITDPKSGKKYRVTAPDGTTPQEALEHFRPQIESGNLGEAASAIDPGPFIKGTGEFLGGLPQGLLGIPEAIYQLGEHTVGLPRPTGAIPDALRRYRDWVESSGAGQAGETVGNIGAFMAGGEIADLLGLGSKLPAAVTRFGARNPGTTTLARTAGESAIAQPVSGDRFWLEKGEQTGLGALLGRILGRTAQQTAHNTALETNKAIDLANTSSAEGNKALDQSLVRRNALADKAAAQARATQGQQAADALNTGRNAQIAAKNAVPQQTTGGWWQRTGDKLGEPISADARPETGAKVQATVGARLNSITDRMNLDPADTSFTEQLNEIRRQTSNSLQAHNQAGFFAQKEATPLERIVLNARGEPQPRTTEAAPPAPTGMWADQVLDPLKKGPLSGRQLTQYITRLGNEANTLATRARAAAPSSPEAADLLAQASALRQVQDTVIGHAAGSAEDKLALEQARQAYLMWGVGNDAAKASRGGVATPAQLIQMMTKRLGEARYKQALTDPNSPYHDDVNWLQQQLQAHTAAVPRVARGSAQLPPAAPRTPERRQTPPLDPERPKVDVPNEPIRMGRIPRALGKSAGAAAAYFLGHPFIATGLGTSAAENLVRPGSEGRLEAILRRALENRPRTARAARATAGATGAQADKLRKAAADLPQKASDALSWAWGSQ